MAKINDTSVIYNASPAVFSANKWLDSSVTGNGKVGAACFGAYANEAILINRSDLRHGGYTGVLQDISDKFPNVRKLYADGKVMEAESFLANEFAKKGCNPRPERPLPLAIVGLDFGGGEFVTDYVRTVDMKNGEVSVSFRQGATRIERNMFVSRANDLIAYEVAKNGPDKINVNFSISVPNGVGLQNVVRKFENGFMYFSARMPMGMDFGFAARIITATGTAAYSGEHMALRGCDGFTLLIKTFVDSNRDTEFKALKNELGLVKNSYAKMLSQHESIHRKLFESSSLELKSDSNKCDIATLLGSVNDGVMDAGLVERLWNFGKYLAICGIGADMPSTAGLWCGDVNVMSSNLTIDNTMQLLYSGIMLSIVPQNVLALFEYYEKYVDDLKKNAARTFGMKGYFIPSAVSPKSALLGGVDAQTIHFVASSALAADVFFKYYLATGDLKTLKLRIFPFMREVCNFYSDFLKLDSNGYYTTIPSYSPKSTPGNTIAGKILVNFVFATNSTIDFLAIGSLLDSLIQAATVLNLAADEIPMWRDMKTKLPTFGATDMGAIREYTNSAFIDGAVNCGSMHTYGLWPLKTFSFNDGLIPYRPAVAQGAMAQNAVISLRQASFNAIRGRLARSGQLQNARTCAMYAVQAAHSLEHESHGYVKGLLMKLVSSCFAPSGLCLSNDWRGSGFTNSEPVVLDICGNLGFATAVTECIVQSNATTLRILPCVFESLTSGILTDIAVDFAAKVSVDWDLRKGKCAVKINPKTACNVDVVIGTEFRKVKNFAMDPEINGVRGIALVPGKPVVLEFQA